MSDVPSLDAAYGTPAEQEVRALLKNYARAALDLHDAIVSYAESLGPRSTAGSALLALVALDKAEQCAFLMQVDARVGPFGR